MKEYESFGPLLRRYLGNAREFTIPPGITAIGDYAFRHCKTLKHITVPDEVTKIGIYAFQWCNALEEIDLPGSVEQFGDGAFMGCSRLRRVTLPDGLESMYIPLLKDCLKLEEITVPGSVRKIVQNAFADCRSLRSLSARMDQLREVPDQVKCLAALTRLEQENSSAAEAAGNYREKSMHDFIEDCPEKLALLAVRTGRPAALYALLEQELLDGSQTDSLLQITEKNRQTQMTAMLLEYQSHREMGGIFDRIDEEFSLE